MKRTTCNALHIFWNDKSFLWTLLLLILLFTHTKADSNCTSNDDCNHNWGTCQDHSCVCRGGWEGDTCDKSDASQIGAGWWVYNYGFAVIFYLESFIALIQLFRIIRVTESWTPTPVKLTFLFIFIQGFIRGIWYSIDAHGQRGIANFYVDAFLYDSGLWPIFVIYITLLYYRFMIYKNIRRENIKPVYRYVAVVLAVAFVAMDYSISIAMFGWSAGVATVAVYLGFIIVSMLIVFLVFWFNGRMLMDILRKEIFSEESRQLKQQHLQKIQFLLGLMTCNVILTIITFVTVVVLLYAVGASPLLYMLQHVVYRLLELSYCGSILFSLRDAVERAREIVSSQRAESIELRKMYRTNSLEV